MRLSRRSQTLALSVGIVLACVAVVALSASLPVASLSLGETRLPPGPSRLMGTDELGRSVAVRTVQALARSLAVGVLAAAIASVIGLGAGLLAASVGGPVDSLLMWLVDALYSIPHLVLMILVAFALGGGTNAVIWSVAITHWGTMARLMRAEAAQLRAALFVQTSTRLGRSQWWVARRHILPHLVPQYITALVLLFPHAILHESALSFLGLGFSPETPSIGVMLAQAMPHLPAGLWWMMLFPGLGILALVLAFDALGNAIRDLTTPATAQL